jgi:hypothetical protein
MLRYLIWPYKNLFNVSCLVAWASVSDLKLEKPMKVAGNGMIQLNLKFTRPLRPMSAAPTSPVLPRLPGVRDCDYRKIIALPTVVNLPEADFDMWRQAVSDKARLIVLGRTVIETVTIEILFKIRPRLDEDQLQVHCS